MSKLIAMVATAVMVDGVRTVIQPGEVLPELTKHDEGELLENGLAMDPEKHAANEKAKKAEEAAALNAFKEAREKVQEAQESTAADANEPSESDDVAASSKAAKAPAKTATPKK